MKRKRTTTKYADRLIANINSNAGIGYYSTQHLMRHFAAHKFVVTPLQQQMFKPFEYIVEDFAALVATLNK